MCKRECCHCLCHIFIFNLIFSSRYGHKYGINSLYIIHDLNTHYLVINLFFYFLFIDQCTVCKNGFTSGVQGDLSRVSDGFRCRRCDGTIKEADLAEDLMMCLWVPTISAYTWWNRQATNDACKLRSPLS